LICRGAKEVDNSQVTEPLKELILKGNVHTIDEMRAWLKPLGYSDTINEAAINFILREFVMSKVPSGSLSNVEMIVESLHPQLEVTTKDIEPFVKPNDQNQTCLGYGMARKGRM